MWALSIKPYQVAKMSGIGCSSKTPGYFLNAAHGVNSVHGRMPSVTTGAYLANRDMIYLGVSGDGDSASIGIGQLVHAIRRRVNMLYIVENNGVYGLTKGQFSATADFGSRSKGGVVNHDSPIDLVQLAIQLGAGFVGRSFSGDKEQLVPLIQAGLKYKGFAFIDVISPCVTFNNHEGSTKSYQHARAHEKEVTEVLYDPHRKEIAAEYGEGEKLSVELHDGSSLLLQKVEKKYDPTDSAKASKDIKEASDAGTILTGLLYLNPQMSDLHEHLKTAKTPLRDMSLEKLSPGKAALEKLNEEYV